MFTSSNLVSTRFGITAEEGKQHSVTAGNHKTSPLVIEPSQETTTVPQLLEWLKANKQTLSKTLENTGAMLVRGFNIDDPKQFEAIGQIIADGQLKSGYLGTSPRRRITDFVFTASEFPAKFPIPHHLEMSFLPNSQPNLIFFYCQEAPVFKNQGETIFCDFRKVYDQFDERMKKKYSERKLKNIRNYCSVTKPASSALSGILNLVWLLVTFGWVKKVDPFRTKPWPHIFETENKQYIEEMCKVDDVKVTWKGNKEDPDLELTNIQPFVKTHPKTGAKIWSNHAMVFHHDSMPSTYRRAATRVGSMLFYVMYLVCWLIIFIKNLLVSANDQAMEATFEDGTPLDAKDMEIVRDLTWQNSVFFDWRKGDVLILDNSIVAHGRLPFFGGKRMILTCFS